MIEKMMIWSVLSRTLQFLNVCAIYYVVQLGKCAMLSAVVLAVILAIEGVATIAHPKQNQKA